MRGRLVTPSGGGESTERADRSLGGHTASGLHLGLRSWLVAFKATDFECRWTHRGWGRPPYRLPPCYTHPCPCPCRSASAPSAAGPWSGTSRTQLSYNPHPSPSYHPHPSPSPFTLTLHPHPNPNPNPNLTLTLTLTGHGHPHDAAAAHASAPPTHGGDDVPPRGQKRPSLVTVSRLDRCVTCWGRTRMCMCTACALHMHVHVHRICTAWRGFRHGPRYGHAHPGGATRCRPPFACGAR